MYRSILVPLDRSTFAEQALPLAARLAHRAGAGLHLAEVHSLYAFKEPHAAWAPYDPDREAEYRGEEQEYLDATAKWVSTTDGIAVRTCPLSGTAVTPETVAECLLERAKNVHADLIVMASHRPGMLSGLALGSVAHLIVRGAGVPVILVRPGDTLVAGALPTEVLVPLDGSTLGEHALEPAIELARLAEASVTLLRVVNPRDEADAAEAMMYLDQVSARVRKDGLEIRTRIVSNRDPAQAIVTAAAERENTLIALGTHGRGGFRRLVFGSVAEQVLHGTMASVLACHPAGGRNA